MMFGLATALLLLLRSFVLVTPFQVVAPSFHLGHHGLHVRSSLPHVRSGTTTTTTRLHMTDVAPQDVVQATPTKKKKKSGHLEVSAEQDMDIPIQVAYDAFADLPRQPSWAHWLSSVEYLPNNDQGETLWKMRYMGVTISWRAVSTHLEPPHVVGWKSTRGLSNYGLVEFEPLSETNTRVKLTMTFCPPAWTVRFLKGRAARFVEEKMLQIMLQNFRNVVVREDLGRHDEEKQANHHTTTGLVEQQPETTDYL